MDNDDIIENSDEEFPLTTRRSSIFPKGKRLLRGTFVSAAKHKPNNNKSKSSSPKEIGSLWNCSLCTFENSGNLQFCDMCDQPRGKGNFNSSMSNIDERKKGSERSDNDNHYNDCDNSGVVILNDSDNEFKMDGVRLMNRVDDDYNGASFYYDEETEEDFPARNGSTSSKVDIAKRHTENDTFDYEDDSDDDFTGAFIPALHEGKNKPSSAGPSAVSGNVSDSYSEDAILDSRRGRMHASLDDVDITSEDSDDEVWNSLSKYRNDPPPSFPAISSTFVSVKDLRRYGSCAVNFSNFMMIDTGGHDVKYDKMMAKMAKRREDQLRKEQAATKSSKSGGKRSTGKKGVKKASRWTAKNRHFAKKKT